jgi:hypothetical protein
MAAAADTAASHSAIASEFLEDGGIKGPYGRKAGGKGQLAMRLPLRRMT